MRSFHILLTNSSVLDILNEMSVTPDTKTRYKLLRTQSDRALSLFNLSKWRSTCPEHPVFSLSLQVSLYCSHAGLHDVLQAVSLESPCLSHCMGFSSQTVLIPPSASFGFAKMSFYVGGLPWPLHLKWQTLPLGTPYLLCLFICFHSQSPSDMACCLTSIYSSGLFCSLLCIPQAYGSASCIINTKWIAWNELFN